MPTTRPRSEDRPRLDPETSSATRAKKEGLVVWLGLPCRPRTLFIKDSWLDWRNTIFWPLYCTYLAMLDQRYRSSERIRAGIIPCHADHDCSSNGSNCSFPVIQCCQSSNQCRSKQIFEDGSDPSNSRQMRNTKTET